MIENQLTNRLNTDPVRMQENLSYTLPSGSTISFTQEGLLRLDSNKVVSQPKLLLISGESESGKSTFGEFGLNEGLSNRVKIYKIIANLQERNELPKIMLPVDQQTDSFKFDPLGLANLISEDEHLKKIAVEKIVKEFMEFHKKTDVLVDVVETVKHPWIVNGLKASDRLHAISVFIEAPEHSRIHRESQHRNLPIEKVTKTVRAKDEWKNSMGNLDVRKQTDIIINNSGTKDDYMLIVSSLLSTLNEISSPHTGQTLELS